MMAFNDLHIVAVKKKIDEVKHFLSISLSISNAHTVDFYTRGVWSTFISVSPEDVLCAISSTQDSTGALEEKENTTFGFCNASKKTAGHISPSEGSKSALFTWSGCLYAAGGAHAQSETDVWRHGSRTVIK